MTKLHMQAEPQGQSYEHAHNMALAWAETSDPRNDSLTTTTIWPDRVGSWNDRYLSGLHRYGLRLTESSVYLMIGDDRYPNFQPMRAPRPQGDEPKLWPEDTWVIYRD